MTRDISSTGPNSTVKKYSLLFFLLFFIASVSIFLLQNHKNGFETGHHGFTSSLAATLSKSLMVEDKHLVMLINKQLLDNGEVYYNPYNRFPVFEYLITGAVIQIFEPDLAMQIYLAKQVMNLFLLASLILCFKIIREILSDKFIALFASLSIFSSYYILYYNDMISNMSTPLFGFILALFLVVKSQRHNLRKSVLILLSMLSISAGWQSYAVFIAWFIVDTLNNIREKRKMSDIVGAVINSPSFIAFAVSITFGFLILSSQILNEWTVRGGGFQEIPTIQRMLARFNLDQSFGVSNQYTEVGYDKDYTEWRYFLILQAFRVFVMIVPFAGIIISKVRPFDLISFLPGLLFATISGLLFLYGLVSFRNKINFTILSVFVLSGLCWAVPLRYYVAWHDHQSAFYIGFSIMYFVVLSFYIKPVLSKTFAIAACLLFMFSVYQMNAIKSVDAQRVNAITADFQKIYVKLPKDSKVFIDCAGKFGKDKFGMDFCRNELSADLGLGGQSLDFYLAGHYRAFKKKADYVISMNRNYNHERLTNNPKINLFKNVTR